MSYVQTGVQAPAGSKTSTGTNVGKVKVLIVDDHPIMRQGIRSLVSQQDDLTVCGEVENAPDALAAIERLAPEVAIVDLTLTKTSGLEFIRDIHKHRASLLVLALSTREESFYAERILRAGAMGYVTKADGAEKIVECIRTMLRGQVYISEKTAGRMIQSIVNGGPDATASPIHNLSNRELSVFELIGHGLSTREVARQLHLSVKTVESHREHIKQKLSIVNSADLVKHAIEWVQMPTEGAA